MFLCKCTYILNVHTCKCTCSRICNVHTCVHEFIRMHVHVHIHLNVHVYPSPPSCPPTSALPPSLSASAHIKPLQTHMHVQKKYKHASSPQHTLPSPFGHGLSGSGKHAGLSLFKNHSFFKRTCIYKQTFPPLPPFPPGHGLSGSGCSRLLCA